MEEIWKDIEGYEGKYKISNLGRVKSLKYMHQNHENILKLIKTQYGYYKIKLCAEGKVKTYLVHRLVAKTFIPNPNNYPCINHKDENKQNNYVDNLEWCTIAYNNAYGTHNESVRQHQQSKRVGQFKLDNMELINIYPSVASTANAIGVSRRYIRENCQGKRESVKGYIFRFLD